MEGYKMETVKPELTFARESKGVWGRITKELVDRVVLEAVAMNVDEEKMRAVRAVAEEEVRALLENNAEFINANTISWAEDIAHAPNVELAEEMKARRLREILDEKSDNNLAKTLSEKIK